MFVIKALVALIFIIGTMIKKSKVGDNCVGKPTKNFSTHDNWFFFVLCCVLKRELLFEPKPFVFVKAPFKRK